MKGSLPVFCHGGKDCPLFFQGGIIMIKVTRINQTQLIINADWIETVEATPDTVITLTNGKKYVVTESIEEIINRVIEYKQKTFILNRDILKREIIDSSI